ncbi:MAG: hypothetical protein ACRBFS_08945 [Aureispira sp.]
MQHSNHPSFTFSILSIISLLLSLSISSNAQTTTTFSAQTNTYQISADEFKALKDLSTFFNDQLQNYPSNYQLHEFTYAYVTHGVDPIMITVSSYKMEGRLATIQKRVGRGQSLVILSIKLKNKQTNRVAQLNKVQHQFTIRFT